MFISIVAAVLTLRFVIGPALPVPRPLIAADSIAFYMWKLLWPAKLGIDYGRTSDLIFRQQWGYFTWLAPVLATTLIVAFAKKAPALAAGGIIFLVGLLPMLWSMLGIVASTRKRHPMSPTTTFTSRCSASR